MKQKQSLLALAGTLAIGVAGVTSPAHAVDVSIDEIMNDQASVGDIVSYGLGPRAQRYSPLDTLNKDFLWHSGCENRCTGREDRKSRLA